MSMLNFTRIGLLVASIGCFGMYTSWTGAYTKLHQLENSDKISKEIIVPSNLSSLLGFTSGITGGTFIISLFVKERE
ncbi:MAG: hypothetical protein ACRCXZ_03705 [Patescibacteria group bacterium]